MAYSEAQVIAGGLIHIPIVIGIFRAVEGRIGRRTIASTSTVVQSSAPAKNSTAATEKAKPRKKAHSNVPVNTYRPKAPFEGKVLENCRYP